MTLLDPIALLLGLISIPIVLLYIIRLRRRPRLMASTMLWQPLVEDTQANAPWQRLRPNVLLLLQLLALLALILALAHPVFSRQIIATGDEIVVLDQSLSMQSRDIQPSRFAVAEQRIAALAGSLAPGHTLSVIAMGSQPRLVVADATSGSAVDQALKSLRPDASGVNVYAALSLASSLIRPDAGTQIIVLTDHASGIVALPGHLNAPVEVVRLGGIRRDVGIASFAAFGGRTTRAILTVRNLGPVPVSTNVDVTADGRLVDVRPLTVAAGATVTESWSDLPAGATRLRAHLTTSDADGRDKTAWAVVRPRVERHVLLVTPGNAFLTAALSVDPTLQLRIVQPFDYHKSLATGEDVVIFDGVFPRVLPPVPTLLVGPPPGRNEGVRIGGLRRGGSFAAVKSGLMSGISGTWGEIERLPRVTLPPWMHVQASAGNAPAVAMGDDGRERRALIVFRLQDSDWPLHISFPLAMHEIMSYLAPGGIQASLTAGSPAILTAPPGTREIAVSGPGTAMTLHTPFLFVPGAPGLYDVRPAPGSSSLVAVNAPLGESDSAAPPVSWFGPRLSASSHVIHNDVALGWVAGVAAFVVLLGEWFAARRP